MVQSEHMQTALMMTMNIRGEENVQQHPHILNQFQATGGPDICTLPCTEQLSCWNSHTGLWRFESITLLFGSPSIHSCQKFIFSHNFTFCFFRPQFPLTVSVVSAHLRKYGSCLSNHEMRKMKLMTTYRELAQEKVHKQKLSNKKKVT